MNRILVWDSPTRILHWLFAGSLTGALVMGFGVDDEHPLFAYHMLLGLAAGFFLLLRLVLGVIGSRHARFSGWAWSPGALMSYLGGIFTGRGERYVSHNPASTWITVVMFVAVALLVGTGLRGVEGASKEVHEVLAGVLIAAIAVHLLGLVWHRLRYRENIARSMIDGRKEGPPDAALTSSYRIAGFAIMILAAGWMVALGRGFDPAARRVRLPFTNIEINLSETHDKEHDDARGHRSRARNHDYD